MAPRRAARPAVVPGTRRRGRGAFRADICHSPPVRCSRWERWRQSATEVARVEPFTPGCRPRSPREVADRYASAARSGVEAWRHAGRRRATCRTRYRKPRTLRRSAPTCLRLANPATPWPALVQARRGSGAGTPLAARTQEWTLPGPVRRRTRSARASARSRFASAMAACALAIPAAAASRTAVQLSRHSAPRLTPGSGRSGLFWSPTDTSPPPPAEPRPRTRPGASRHTRAADGG
jgi:hypothetical protein